jgi:hypothetical protein
MSKNPIREKCTPKTSDFYQCMDGGTHLVDDVVPDQSLYPAIVTLIEPLHLPRMDKRGKTIETTRHRHLMERKVGHGKQQREDSRGDPH